MKPKYADLQYREEEKTVFGLYFKELLEKINNRCLIGRSA